MNSKAAIRASYKKPRLAMSRVAVEERSQTICRALLNEIDWQKIKNVHLYQAMAKFNEVDLADLSSVIKWQFPDIELATVAAAKNQPLPVGKFDIILVPVLAFDKEKNRLGWGGGWYDRFLARQPQALKIGLCFEAGHSSRPLPREAHDIALDLIITEENTY